MPPCGCSGSNQAASPRRSAARQQPPSPSQVPGGPGTPGYTWDGPKKRAAAVDSGSTKKQ